MILQCERQAQDSIKNNRNWTKKINNRRLKQQRSRSHAKILLWKINFFEWLSECFSIDQSLSKTLQLMYCRLYNPFHLVFIWYSYEINLWTKISASLTWSDFAVHRTTTEHDRDHQNHERGTIFVQHNAKQHGTRAPPIARTANVGYSLDASGLATLVLDAAARFGCSDGAQQLESVDALLLQPRCLGVSFDLFVIPLRSNATTGRARQVYSSLCDALHFSEPQSQHLVVFGNVAQVVVVDRRACAGRRLVIIEILRRVARLYDVTVCVCCDLVCSRWVVDVSIAVNGPRVRVVGVGIVQLLDAFVVRRRWKFYAKIIGDRYCIEYAQAAVRSWRFQKMLRVKGIL